MKILISQLQLEFIRENIESFSSNNPKKPTPTQLPKYTPSDGYQVNPNYDSQKEMSKIGAISTYTHNIPNNIQKKLEENRINVFEEFRSFMYSPEGIGLTVLLDSTEIGMDVPVILFGILLSKDICDWIEYGEPNWIYLVSDLICMLTAGFSSPLIGPLVRESNLTIKQIFNKFPKILEFLKKNINKITPLISKILTILKDFINKNFSKIKFMKEFLKKIEQNYDKIIQKIDTLKQSFLIYIRYKSSSEIFTQFMSTKPGQDFLNFAIPKINPLLGPDKVPDFLITLSQKTPSQIIEKYFKL